MNKSDYETAEDQASSRSSLILIVLCVFVGAVALMLINGQSDTEEGQPSEPVVVTPADNADEYESPAWSQQPGTVEEPVTEEELDLSPPKIEIPEGSEVLEGEQPAEPESRE